MLVQPTIKKTSMYFNKQQLYTCVIPAEIRLFVDMLIKGNELYFVVNRPYLSHCFQPEIKKFIWYYYNSDTYYLIYSFGSLYTAEL